MYMPTSALLLQLATLASAQCTLSCHVTAIGCVDFMLGLTILMQTMFVPLSGNL